MLRHGGHRYCKNCGRIVETRVFPEGYGQVDYNGAPTKRRKVICGTDAQGIGGCGYVWFTLEIPQELLDEITGRLNADLDPQ